MRENTRFDITLPIRADPDCKKRQMNAWREVWIKDSLFKVTEPFYAIDDYPMPPKWYRMINYTPFVHLR